MALACVALTTLIVYLDRAGYRDGNAHVDSWLDALYYSTVTLSTTGYGDITPASAHARLVNVLIVTPLRLLFLIVLVGTTIEVLTKRTRQAIRTKLWRQRVQDHVIVVGYGVKGASAMKAIVEQGRRADEIVVVDRDGSHPRRRSWRRSGEGQNLGVLRQSGADVVIPTAESAGRMLGLPPPHPRPARCWKTCSNPGSGSRSWSGWRQ